MLVIDKIPEMVQPNVYNVIDEMENNIIIIYFFSTVILSKNVLAPTNDMQHWRNYSAWMDISTIFFC